MLESGVRIPSLDGKDIFISNHYLKKNEVGYKLRNQNGDLNLSRFINTLDYSLDLIKMQEVYASVYKQNDFSFHKNGKDYTQRVINVTFKYSNKLFNRVRNNLYVKFGYAVDDLVFEDCVAFHNGELVGIQVGEDVKSPLDKEKIDKCFYFENGTYQVKANIPILNGVADIRSQIYQDGFYCDGIHFVRFKRSSGSSRVGKCLFIDERLYDQMHEWEMCGIEVKHGQDIDLAALEPYIALTLSSIVGTIQIRPENILVIDDYSSVFKERAVATRLVDGRLVSKPEDVEISNSIWDGQSLMDKSLFGEYKQWGMLLLRARFFKSCCFNANIQEWFRDNGITEVSQLNGRTQAKRIEDVKLITTPSSIKYLKFGNLDTWLNTLETTFGVVKHEKPTHFFDGRMVQTHYQLLNTLQMAYQEVEQLVQPSLDFAKMVKTDPAALRYQISYQYHSPDDTFYTKAVTSKNDIIYRLLSINDKFAETKMYRQFCNDLIKSFIKNLRCGHILVHGNYSTLCGNSIEMLKQAIGTFDGTSVIEINTVHSTKFENGKELLGSRSPHVTVGNVLVTTNVWHDEITKYMNSTPEIVYINSIGENILERLSGADFDSDTMLLTDNEILVTAAKRNYQNFPVPTKLVESAKRKRKYTNEEKADLDVKTSVNKIGEIINLSQELNSILWDRLNSGESVSDVMDLYCDISQLDVMSNLEIDSAKRENPANNTYELQCLKKKYDVRDKKNRHVRPLFFKYIDGYKGYRDDYYLYSDQDDDIQKIARLEKSTEAYKFKSDYEAKSKESGNEVKVIVERGRMSYRSHKTSMDYLQHCIDKNFSMPRKQSTKLLSDILTCPDDSPEEINLELEEQTLCLIKDTKAKINGVWNSDEFSSREKRELAQETRVECIQEMTNIDFNQSTLYHFLCRVEQEDIQKNNDNGEDRYLRFLFYLMMDEQNWKMRSAIGRLIFRSKTKVYELVESDDGDILIYNFKYRRVENGMPYESSDEMKNIVNSFLSEYGLKTLWFANKIGIDKIKLSRFLSGQRPINDTEQLKKMYLFIDDYKERMSGLM
jgi:hypothetical protein